ncbi:MAG: hypothetical protein NZ928_02175 [Endomicrobia bacterium]|nr:hypothetical protein [Endomicrobiia bacterium]MCX7940287.1 hypothetical protein [Endomicrobiia bacterium]MDW8055809.1 hypothetical protein [Elusimicrobiota bacterium]
MTVSDLIDNYMLNFIFPKGEILQLKFSLRNSFLIFLLSILSLTISRNIVLAKDIFFFIVLFPYYLIFFMLIIGIYIGSVFLVRSLKKKSYDYKHLLCIILNFFSLYILLLPVSFICYYLNLTRYYFYIELTISIIILFNVLKYTKAELDFSIIQMFFILVIPFMIMVLFLLSVFGLFFVSLYV